LGGVIPAEGGREWGEEREGVKRVCVRVGWCVIRCRVVEAVKVLRYGSQNSWRRKKGNSRGGDAGLSSHLEFLERYTNSGDDVRIST